MACRCRLRRFLNIFRDGAVFIWLGSSFRYLGPLLIMELRRHTLSALAKYTLVLWPRVAYTLCSKKHVTTFLIISWSRTVRLERFLADLLLRVQAIDWCFYFPTSPISCSCFTLGNCQNLKCKNHENFTGRCDSD